MPHQDVDTKSSDRPRAHIRIIVVGAGLSGLAAAIQSALGGNSVLVLESAKVLGEVSRKIHVSFCHVQPRLYLKSSELLI